MESDLANGIFRGMTELETIFKEVALRCGREALSEYLSNIPEEESRCDECGSSMRSIGKRPKTIVTMLGELTYYRHYYGCMNENCDGHAIPKDEQLGVSGTRFTEAVRRATSKIAASDSFFDTSANLQELCGISVSAKETEIIAEEFGAAIMTENEAEIKAVFNDTISTEPDKSKSDLYIEYDGTGTPIRKAELIGTKGKQPDGSAKTKEMKTCAIFTSSRRDKEDRPIRDSNSSTYFAKIQSSDQFSELLYSKAVLRGVNHAKRVIVIGDGAQWIWTLAEENFKEAIHIVDLFHAKEHIMNLLKCIYSDESQLAESKAILYELLENGNITKLLEAFDKLPALTEQQCDKLELERNYFNTNRTRMRYKEFRDAGLFIGSGVIEAACKNVIGKRLKQSGMHWSVDGANKIAALRCHVLSGKMEPITAA